MAERLDRTSLAGGAVLVAIGVLLVLDVEDVLAFGVGWLAPLLIGAAGVVLLASGGPAGPAARRTARERRPPPPPTLHVPVAPEELRAYRTAAGTLDVDLRQLELPAEGPAPRVVVRVALGTATVRVPEGLTVIVAAQVFMGHVDAFGLTDGGIGIRTARQHGEGEPRLVVDVGAGIGTVELVRA